MLEGFIFRSTTAEKVLAFETENGIVLPEDYRCFLTTDAPHPGSVSGPVDEVMPVLKIYCPAAYAWFGPENKITEEIRPLGVGSGIFGLLLIAYGIWF